ncbi:MAG: aldo/keto reductase [Burkholderiaceae bacterium]|nr:aldo/keto reductase [Burkholderiaceae bacterium]
MNYRELPGTGLKVSEICLGTMTWGQQNTEAEAHEQLEYAVSNGVNFIDTAEMYPVPPRAETQARTERFLGNWLGSRPRGDLVIATKIAGPGRRDWIRGGRTDITPANIAEAVGQSLERLKIDVIDLYQIHWAQRNIPAFGPGLFDPSKEREGPSIESQVEGMAAMIEAGRIRHWGLSNETAWGVSAFHRAAEKLGVPGPVTLQNSYSLVSRSADFDLAEALFRENMSVLAYSPLGGGMLSGKYLGGALPKGSRFEAFETLGQRFRLPMVVEAIDAYAALAREKGLSLVQLALGYVRSRWFVGSTIIGATTMEQLAENIAAGQFELDADTLSAIAKIQARYPNPGG